MIPVITGLGGLLVGIITTRFSPESEGHGTDAVIDAYHHKAGKIRARYRLSRELPRRLLWEAEEAEEQKDLLDK